MDIMLATSYVSFSLVTTDQLIRMRLSLLRYTELRCPQCNRHTTVRRLSGPVSRDATTHATRNTDANDNTVKDGEGRKTIEPKKTIAELDDELRMKLEGRSGDGGAAGLELENGQPVAM